MDLALSIINLPFQLVILVAMLGSLALKQKHKYFGHGIAMLLAAVLNAVSFVWVMGPSLPRIGELVANQPFNVISLVTVAHASSGTIAEILAIWIIVPWRLRSSTQYCIRKRKMMRVAPALRLIALLVGVIFYVLTYTSLIP
jgi:hypothetical protein